MMASSVWLIVATTLAYQGHPLTAGLIALPWLWHRRWEHTRIGQ
jgi:hypothetical protein